MELEKVLNEHEVHYVLEGMDLLFKYADHKKLNFNQRNFSREQKMRDFLLEKRVLEVKFGVTYFGTFVTNFICKNLEIKF